MHVYVLRGAPRSGKSTLVRVFKKMFNDVEVVSADDYWTGPAGLYSYDMDFEPEAHCFCFRRFMFELDSRREVIVVDNTCSRILEAAPYMLAAASDGYLAKLVTVMCSVETMIERNKQSSRGPLPENIIHTMAARIAAADPPPWWKHSEWDEKSLDEACKLFKVDPASPDNDDVERRQLNG